MIANENERAAVVRHIQQLKNQRDEVLRACAGQTLATRVEVACIAKMIARLQEEIDTYDGLSRRAVTENGGVDGGKERVVPSAGQHQDTVHP